MGTCCYQTRKNPTLSYSMWNSLPLPFVCEIHKLKCPPKFLKKHTHPKRCLYYNHLPHNPISAAHRQKNYYKKEALALTDQNLASSCKNCSRSNFFRPLLA